VRRIGLVVHPSREIGTPLHILEEWAAERDVEVVQVETPNQERVVATFGEVSHCDVVVAIGGDGTVLTALRVAAENDTPVLGVACGSLGALSAVTADELREALDAYESGEWTPRRLPALDVESDGASVAWSLNDLVLVRRAGQLIVDITIGDELYARTAGDGVIVATALGSSAYSMAADGPVLVVGTDAYVVTPLLMHGGSAPPVVVPGSTKVTLVAHPGYGGFDVEVDGHRAEIDATSFTITLAEHKATLVAIAEPGLGIEPLRRRGLITDSPRVRARDERSATSRPS
jgi:NAD+ kinase